MTTFSERRKPISVCGTGTCYHWYATDEVSRGINGEEYGLTYKDLVTGWVDCFPRKDKDTSDTVRALRSIASPSDIKVFLH